MGKLLSWIVLGLFVVVVPFGSWYYLNQGLNYRKAALAELLVKDSISINVDTLGLLQGKTTVLVLHSNDEINKHLDQLNEQFKKTDGFQILSYDTSSAYIHLAENYFGDTKFKYKENDYVLIDTSSHIRNVYKADMDGVKKLIEHLAIVIPRVKEVDIKLKQ